MGRLLFIVIVAYGTEPAELTWKTQERCLQKCLQTHANIASNHPQRHTGEAFELPDWQVEETFMQYVAWDTWQKECFDHPPAADCTPTTAKILFIHISS